MKQSFPARCERPGCACGNVALVLVVTRSPVPEWEWLVLERCVGQIHQFQGVEAEVQNIYGGEDGA